MAKSSGRSPRRRSPGEGSVYRVGSRWRGSVQQGAQRITVCGTTSAEAREKLDAERARLGVGLPASTKLTLGEYLAGWVDRDRVRVRPSTWRSREMHVRAYLVPALGHVPLASLSAEDVEHAMARFLASGRPERPAKRGRGRQNAGGVSPTTVRHIRATLRRALRDAVKDRKAVRNAAADADPPAVEHRPIVYLASRDLRKLIEATREDEYGPVYALAASTGLRLGELLGLSWADVEGGIVRVRRSLTRTHDNGWTLGEPKSARSRRSIPLPLVARQALETQRTRQRFARNTAGSAWQDVHGLVFTDEIGRPLRPGAVSREFGKARDRAGIPRVRFHDLRHSAATALLAEGVPLAVISEWLGHSGIEITMRHYAAVVPELHEQARDAMDRALG